MQPQENQHNDAPLNFTSAWMMPPPVIMQLGKQPSSSNQPESENEMEYLLFDMNCMSMERAHTLLSLSLHQLWILSWMSVKS